jgi:putative copper export protein
MMMLGALHKYRWVPRLRAAIETGNIAYVSRGLSRSLRLEMVMAALVLLLTATLTSVTGPAG